MKVPIPDSYWLIDGQLLAGEYPSTYDDDRARDKLGALLEAGIRSFIDLTETVDPLMPYQPMLRELASERGLDVRYTRLPIRDMDIPTVDRMTEILDTIRAELRDRRPVYFHCWGGIGRTGTVTCCWLVDEHALTCDAALKRIVDLRKGIPDARVESPQTDAQRQFVRRWQRPRS